MKKLVFSYGVMGSAKTANALMKYFEFKSNGCKALLLKPRVDDRDGEDIIKSRIGLSQKAVIVDTDDDILDIVNSYDKVDVIIVDEAQFLEPCQIDQLKIISIQKNISVFAYGLKTNFKSLLFPGSKRLIEIADELRELETSCSVCGERAEVTAKINSEGKVIADGEVVDIGGNEKYKPMCYKCWDNSLEK